MHGFFDRLKKGPLSYESGPFFIEETCHISVLGGCCLVPQQPLGGFPDVPVCNAGDKTNQNGGDEGALPDAGQSTAQDKAQDGSQH